MAENVFFNRINEFTPFVFAFNPASSKAAERPEIVSEQTSFYMSK